jgi:hypothetical protein
MKQQPTKCLVCDQPIPKTRKRSSRYCSLEHYYEAKLNRSITTYAKAVASTKELKKNEKILESFYLLVELKRDIFFEDLQQKMFNWSISFGDTLGPDNETIYKIIGQYAYHLNPSTRKVNICKLK